MKNKTALSSGLALFLSFTLLTATGKLSMLFEGNRLFAAMLILEIAAFLLPTALIKVTATKENPIQLRTFLKISSTAVIRFAFFSGISVSILTFLINYALFRTTLHTSAVWNQLSSQINGNIAGAILAVCIIVLISPICEEIFLRGALFSAHEKFLGTSTCIVLSGLCFALIHGSLENFIAPLLTGCLYAYLTYVFDCVWPAVFAHVVNNFFFVALQWLTNTYSAFGIWQYVPAICALLLLGCLYCAFRALETLLIMDNVRHFKAREKTGNGLLRVVCNPGFVAFLLAFVAKAIFSLF